LGSGDLFAAVLGEHPDVLEPLEDLHDAAWRVADPVLLELCRLRIAFILGCEFEQELRTPVAAGLDEATRGELPLWPTSKLFGPRERACLALCEQFVIDVASMNDDLIFAVSGQLGADELRDFVRGLLVVEQRQRLRLAWERLLDSPLDPAPATAGPRRTSGGEREGHTLSGALKRWQAAVVRLDGIDPITTEVVRLRCARYHNCRT